MARAISARFNDKVEIIPSEQYRAGDVRHRWADINKIRTRLGFTPRILFPAALDDLLMQTRFVKVCDHLVAGHAELLNSGLIS